MKVSKSPSSRVSRFPNLVLLRHGESVWNRKNLFTGWIDVSLSKKGREEAAQAGRLLRRRQLLFDRAYTSALKRAQQTLAIVTKELDQKLPIERSWQLNERHYGALQGMNKLEMAKRYGKDQVLIWRRSYGVRPPALQGRPLPGQLSPSECGLPAQQFPRAESLRDTYKRVIPYWKKFIVPALKRGERVLIVAHGNSLRALVKYIEDIPDKRISMLEIPTGKPLGYFIEKDGRLGKKFRLKP